MLVKIRMILKKMDICFQCFEKREAVDEEIDAVRAVPTFGGGLPSQVKSMICLSCMAEAAALAALEASRVKSSSCFRVSS